MYLRTSTFRRGKGMRTAEERGIGILNGLEIYPAG